MFYNTLLTGKHGTENGAGKALQKNSIAQDIIDSVSNGRLLTPKSVLFPAVVKSLCNNTEVLRMLNKLGHGISYDLGQEIEREHALDVINEQRANKVVIPEDDMINAADNAIAVMIADNIDNLESTITGFGTSHRVNSILVTKKVEDNAEESEITRPTKRKCLRSLPDDRLRKDLPDYYAGKRTGPGALKWIQNLDESQSYKEKVDEQKLTFLSWIALRSLKSFPRIIVQGWTGFNIAVRNNVVIMESKISYLDAMDSPATDLKTAFEVLCRGMEIKDRLRLKAVVCVFDQAFYAKAVEVQWKNRDVFKDLVLMLGGFHLLMMHLGILGCRYGDAGLREIAVQSEVIAEGSVDKALEGKNYNRAVRMHKVMYEALSRLLYENFEAWMAEKNPDVLSQSREVLEDLKLNTSQEKFDAVKKEGVVKELYEFYLKYLVLIEKEGSDLQRFWLTYLQLCELLLNLIFATRVGDWELYLSCVEEVIPWAFAYDRQKYARYLLPFLDDMRKLPAEKPDVYAAFTQGEFSVQMSTSNPFGRNEADKTIENTINRDCKTSGGYIGFSSSFPATQRWVLNAARRGQYRRLFREQIGLKSKKYVHKEMAPARVKLSRFWKMFSSALGKVKSC